MFALIMTWGHAFTCVSNKKKKTIYIYKIHGKLCFVEN